ncbi:class I adenylate-forming enzyme family protein [Nonomuraea rhodomycinica]|uniref:AMP-binding protein n=1 Tax=Nonomuraea rhodomycinica TaxID=1712872 RepID=A0A7Y6II55_9ACTN|nr:AMP-binding protein [Nonomuraea rhodomycinica]NUW38699.1 AMP-binding protein [Nonomuraea rhodomycinica]
MSVAPSDAVHHLLEQAAARSPEAPAVQDRTITWTYAELLSLSLRFARWLRHQGIRPGDRVMTKAANSAHLAAILFGTSMAGAIFVPANHQLTPFQMERIITDAEPSLILTSGSQKLASDLPVHEIEAIWPDVVTTEEGAPGLQSRPCAPALLIYTSGSTSTPKGVVCPHSMVLFAVEAIAERLAYTSDDRIFLRLPMSFDYGLYQLLLSVRASACVQISDIDSGVTLLSELRASASTIMPVVPPLAQLLVQLADRAPVQVSSVRLFTNTGAQLSPALAHDLRANFPGSSVVFMFGITECKRVSISVPDEDLIREGSLGRPLTGTDVWIEGPTGAPLPAGEIGQIVVRGPHVMAGYWRAPELTAQRFCFERGGAALRTGDYGWLDETGNLYFHGRRDDVFKRRGTRVSLTEVEAAAEAVPGVREAVAVHDRLVSEEDLSLVVTGSLSPQEVLAELTNRLDKARIPDRCFVVPTISLSPNGKADRTTVRDEVRMLRTGQK